MESHRPGLKADRTDSGLMALWEIPLRMASSWYLIVSCAQLRRLLQMYGISRSAQCISVSALPVSGHTENVE